MSFDAFNREHDNEVKRNLQETLDSETKKDSKKKGEKINLTLTPKKEIHKQSITFSVTPDQADKIQTVARERGFKNRSELLAAIIDSL